MISDQFDHLNFIQLLDGGKTIRKTGKYGNSSHEQVGRGSHIPEENIRMVSDDEVVMGRIPRII